MTKVQDLISSLISEKQYYLRFFFLDISSIAWPTISRQESTLRERHSLHVAVF